MSRCTGRLTELPTTTQWLFARAVLQRWRHRHPRNAQSRLTLRTNELRQRTGARQTYTFAPQRHRISHLARTSAARSLCPLARSV